MISNQIIKLQNNRNLIAFYDNLTPVIGDYYAQIHSKKEEVQGKSMPNSLIKIMLQDYSKGTGSNNVIVDFNLEPEILQFILTRVSAGFLEYEYTSQKIFGEPDQNGYSIAQGITISRHVLDRNGVEQRNPWCICIENGKGIRVKNRNGGFYMKGGSFIQEKYASINLADMDMYKLLKRVDSYITAWEMAVSSQTVLDWKQRFLVQREQYKNNLGNPPENFANQVPGNYPAQEQPYYDQQNLGQPYSAEPYFPMSYRT